MKRNSLIDILLFSIILVSCDNRIIYEKSSLTERLITKRIIDTTIITDQNLYIPLLLAQKNTNLRHSLITKNVDSIYQTNYWLKTKGSEVVETLKRLHKTIMKYNEGRLIYKITYQNDGDTYLNEHFYYDDYGLLLAQHETNSALNLVEELLIYSKDDIVIGKEHMSGKGKIMANSTIIYNVSNKSIVETTDWHDSETKSRVVKILDDKGNVIKEMFHEALMNKQLTDTTEKVIEYKYDLKNNLISQSQYNTWGMTSNYKEALYSITSFSYDEHGNINTLKEIKADGNVMSEFIFQYQYDAKGNWIEKIAYKNGQPESKLIRKIIYN